jgi:4,5-DOPA dioxygenase extradiol
MSSHKIPVLFIGHGSPMNIVYKNEYTKSLQKLGTSLPKPDAILVVSAHWLTTGTFVCSADKPEQIYDFYGFPDELYAVKYHPLGARAVAESIANELKSDNIQSDNKWGIDHASWAVLTHMYPKADIPVFEMSLDVLKNEREHYNLGKKLSFLRTKNILILGSGNIVHNLRQVDFDEHAEPFPWAIEFDEYIKEALLQKDHERLIRYKELSPASRLAVPTNDHYLPFLYSAALQEEDEQIEFVHESIQNGSMSMRCFIIH